MSFAGGERMSSDQPGKPEGEPVPQGLEKRPYEPPKVESIQLSEDAAEAPT
jgi:hypothetical protein